MPRIEAVRQQRLLTIGRDEHLKQLRLESPPPTNVRGFYWFYTNYTLDELEAAIASEAGNAIDLPWMTALHRDLAHVCTITQDGFRLVYNGIAGESLGIRKRLGQHINGGEGTGALHIRKSSLSDLTRWRYSYATIDAKGPIKADVPMSFADAKSVERIWRLEHGWPLFCTR